MNCTRCNNPLPPNVAYCPYCNEPVPQAAAQGGYPQGVPPYGQGYAGQPGYPQESAPGYGAQQPGYGAQEQSGYGAQTPNYGYTYGYGMPPGYQPPYGQGAGMRRPHVGPSPFLNSLTSLPRTCLGAFTKPGETLQDLVQAGDYFTGLILTGLSVLLAFFSTMICMNRLIPADVLTQALGIASASVVPSLAGVGVLLRLVSLAVLLGTLLIYLCAVMRLRFSMEMMAAILAVTGVPLCLTSALNLILSLISPALACLATLTGLATSYVLLACVIQRVQAHQSAECALPKVLCVAGGVLATLGLCALIAYTMGSNLLGRVLSGLTSALL